MGVKCNPIGQFVLCECAALYVRFEGTSATRINESLIPRCIGTF